MDQIVGWLGLLLAFGMLFDLASKEVKEDENQW